MLHFCNRKSINIFIFFVCAISHPFSQNVVSIWPKALRELSEFINENWEHYHDIIVVVLFFFTFSLFRIYSSTNFFSFYVRCISSHVSSSLVAFIVIERKCFTREKIAFVIKMSSKLETSIIDDNVKHSLLLWMNEKSYWIKNRIKIIQSS